MKMVIGGTFQGKLAYAKERYQITDGWVDGAQCEVAALETCKGVYHFHELIRNMIQNSEKEQSWITGAEDQAEAFAAWLYEKNPEIVIVTNELGYGIVPMDRFDREYREMTGRICTALAKRSEEVVRVACGLGLVIKGTKETA
ncbi:MAG: bifunctional adenosylcobinamide kinase/adenosylcobinamide-phosphate guanylyltransferase [Lachnospiraceae bacterium]|nr:bifunctional adenosylcobinamide kinase/adenosylcobinamide-phosphate guanylyltransferase [Lachnospiraceae bacterium]